MFFRAITIATLTATLIGCGTIMNGTTQKVGISSNPTGARVTVNNIPFGNTPLFADLKRKDSHIISLELDGYEKAQLTVTNSLSGWVWGNIVFGGIIGLAVDAISGGLYKLTTEQLHAEMRRNGVSATETPEGVMIIATLNADPTWEKIGELTARN